MFKKKATAILALSVFAVSFASAHEALAQARQEFYSNDGRVVSIQASAQDQAQAAAEWSTVEARRAAQPLPMPRGGSFSSTRINTGGQPGMSPAGPPAPDALTQAQALFPDAWAALAENAPLPEGLGPMDGATFGTSGRYTSYITNYFEQMYVNYPWISTGKLYITGGGYCSASMISPNNIIVTAAHCVYNTDTNSWYAGWTFVPAERDGYAPVGTFSWSNAAFLTAWKNALNSTAGRRYDLALIKLAPNGAGTNATYYTGWLGRAWDLDYRQELFAIGYPNALTGGDYTYTCAAETFLKTTDVLGMGCNMQHGSSGGPWIYKFMPYQWGANNYVNSVVSGGISGTTWGNTFYGPKFRSTNILALCNFMGC